MRIIKFKGKDRNGKWICGGIVNAQFDSGDKMFIVNMQDLGMVEVCPSSVGQYTGLSDKNGRAIYEGDIVKWDDGSNGKYWRIAVVKYEPDICFDCGCIKVFGDIKNSCDYCFHYKRFAYQDTQNHLIVIGNIADYTPTI